MHNFVVLTADQVLHERRYCQSFWWIWDDRYEDTCQSCHRFLDRWIKADSGPFLLWEFLHRSGGARICQGNQVISRSQRSWGRSSGAKCQRRKEACHFEVRKYSSQVTGCTFLKKSWRPFQSSSPKTEAAKRRWLFHCRNKTNKAARNGGNIFIFCSHYCRARLSLWRTDRQTNGQTKFSSPDRVCIPCSAVKTKRLNYFQQTLMKATLRKSKCLDKWTCKQNRGQFLHPTRAPWWISV